MTERLAIIFGGQSDGMRTLRGIWRNSATGPPISTLSPLLPGSSGARYSVVGKITWKPLACAYSSDNDFNTDQELLEVFADWRGGVGGCAAGLFEASAAG